MDTEVDNWKEESREEAQAIYDWAFNDPIGQEARELYYQGKWEEVAYIWYRLGGGRLIKLLPKEVISRISEMIFCMGYRECDKRYQVEQLNELMKRS